MPQATASLPSPSINDLPPPVLRQVIDALTPALTAPRETFMDLMTEEKRLERAFALGRQSVLDGLRIKLAEAER